MGWQEEQAAGRAREQQRQADQRAASARQAESIRQENQARDRANREKVNADLFAANARRDSERRARDQAASDKAHTDRMAQIKRDGQSTWSSPSPYTPSHTANKETVSTASGSYPVKKKSKGGGWFLLFLIVGVIYGVGHSGSSGSSGPSSQATSSAPIVEGSSQPPVDTKTPASVTDSSVTQDTHGDSTGTVPANGSTPDSVTTANDVPTNTATNGQGTNQLAEPTSTLLEPIYRPDAVYPDAAMTTRLTGPVIVVVGVQTNGVVISATPESGDSLLMPAALDAAKRWTFKPYTYEPGKPVRTMRIEFPFNPPAS